MNLRKLAKGQPCMVRIPDVCNYNLETTVLAHLNGGGMGMKHNDLLGAWCCSACHAWLDGGFIRTGHAKYVRDLWHMEAIARTQQELLNLGLQEAIDKWRG